MRRTVFSKVFELMAGGLPAELALGPLRAKVILAGLILPVLAGLICFPEREPAAGAGRENGPAAAERPADFGKLPVSFELNRGQADETVRFLAHGPHYNLYLTDEQAVLTLFRATNAGAGEQSENAEPSTATVTMKLAGGQRGEITGANRLEGRVNYIVGNDPRNWKMDVPTYGRVRYAGVYPGVDLVYYGNQTALEYDFIVAPGGDPNAIGMTFDGARKISIDERTGELVIVTATGEIRQHAPLVYQESDGGRQTVEGRYKIVEAAETPVVGFELGSYDRGRPLVIDPVLLYSSYLGGSQTNPLNAYGEDGGVPAGDGSNSIAVDSDGFAYIAGVAHSTDFPTFNGLQPQCQTDVQSPPRCFHAFVAKFNREGSGLVYATYLGGRLGEFGLGYTYAQAIAVDRSGNAYVTGKTTAPDFPTTPGSFQSTPPHPSLVDGSFVAKLNPNGALGYATFLNGNAMSVGGGRSTVPRAIAVDGAGNVYVAGRTTEPDFPTRNGFQPRCLPVGLNNICQTAGYLAKLDATGANLLYSSYIGSAARIREGTEPPVMTQVNDVTVDDEGNAYLVGATNLNEFPVRRPLAGQGAQHDGTGCFRGNNICNDGFVMKIKTTAAGAGSLAFSSFLGAVGEDAANGVALDPEKNLLVAGYTISPGFPVTPNAFDRTCGNTRECSTNGDGFGDGFVTKIDPKLTKIVYSTFFGGDRTDFAARVKTDESGRIYLTGSTYSTDFPTTLDTLQNNLGSAGPAAFVTRFGPTGETDFSSYLHGTDNAFEATYGTGIAVDAGDNIYLTGSTTSHAFPVRNAFQDTHHGLNGPNVFSFNAFVTKIGTPTPVIFIPGISGSYLNDRGAMNLERWIGPSTDHGYLTLDQTSPFYRGDNIFAPDVIRTFTTAGGAYSADVYGTLLDYLKQKGGYVEYDVNNDPARRTPEGCDVLNQQNNHPTLFVMAYDWRRDNAGTADQQLAGYVQCIRQFYGANTKVSIVTHSMGSLIARRYILDHPGTVKKLITIGAPWLGGPKSINVLATGNFLDYIGHLVVAGENTFKFLAQDFTGAHQLIPTRGFFLLGGRPYYEHQENGNFKIYNNYDDFTGRLNELYPRTRPGDNDKLFHDYPGQDDWRDDASGVEYYHIIGVRSVADTINRIISEPGKRVCTVARGIVNCRIVYDYRLEYTAGDGTVPRLSAERKANGLNLNAPNAKIFPFFKASEGYIEDGNKAAEHTGMAGNPAVQSTVLTFLNKVAAPPAARNRSVRRQTAEVPAPPAAPNYYLKILGLPGAVVADAFGHATTPLENGSELLAEVPGVNYRRLDAETIAVTLPADGSYTVDFRMPPQGIALEWTKGTDKTITAAGRYLDLGLPAGVGVELSFSASALPVLRYDADGSGDFETLVSPTAQTAGAAAADRDAPLVSFDEAVKGNQSTLSIEAADAGSGVAAVMCSTDGTIFQPYAGPLSLAAGQTVYAFADDGAGNRSDTVSYLTGSAKLKLTGRIADGENRGIEDVVLNLTDQQTNVTTETVGGGQYLLAGLTPGGSYTLTPENPFYTFSPPSVAVTDPAPGATVDFTATRKTYTISGRVTDDENRGLPGVALGLNDGRTAVSDQNGDYVFANLAAGEDYTVTASKAFVDFKQTALQIVALAANETIDFTGTEKRFGIAGGITDVEGRGFGHLPVTLTGSGQTLTTQTDASGFYFFDELAGGGDYTVTPARPGVTFTPQTRAFSNLTDDATGDFAAPVSPNTWTGAVSSDWFTDENWAGGAVPGATAGVIVPAGALNEIVIGSNDVTVAGLTLAAGRTLTVAAGRTLTVTGNADLEGTLDGPGAFDCGGRAVFDGTAPQTVPAGTIAGLTIDNPAGVGLLGDLTVFVDLQLTNGVLDAGAFTLTLETAAAVARTNGFVAGSLRKNFPGFVGGVRKNAGFGGPFVFPVGTNTGGEDYSPVDANVVNVGGAAGYLTVRAVDAVSPAPISGPRITRYWQLDGAAVTVDLTFHYLAEDAAGIGDQTSLRVFRNAASVCPDDCVDEALRTATVLNVAEFSPWTIAALTPTAAGVAIGGRVAAPDGRAVANAVVEMTDAAGRVRRARTNSFGFFRFDDVAAGQVLAFAVRHRAYRFEPRVVTVVDRLEDLDFTAVSGAP